MVLSVGDTVEEVSDSGLLATTPTLAVGLLEDDAIVQVRSPFYISLVVCSFHKKKKE